MVTGPAGIITSARSRRPGRRHSTQRRVTMLPCSPARMLPITLASPHLQPVMLPFLRLRVAIAPVGLETLPTSAKTMLMLTVRLIGVLCTVAAPTPRHSAAALRPVSLSHPSERRASRAIAAHTRRLCSRLASPPLAWGRSAPPLLRTGDPSAAAHVNGKPQT